MAIPPPNVPLYHGFPDNTYEPLNTSSNKPSIRLATLQAGTSPSSIRVTLTIAAFADRPKYEALSYAWGKPDVVKEIELDGKAVEIRVNLWDALVYLRSAEEDRVLWIDAICINQADILERNNQVEQMAYIFGRARTVLVWLGVIEPIPVVSEVDNEEDPDVSREVENLAKETAIILCSQPYWYRVWIVQEISVATELRVHWGSRSYDWDTFFGMIHELFPSPLSPLSPSEIDSPPSPGYGNSREDDFKDFMLQLLAKTKDHPEVLGALGIQLIEQSNPPTEAPTEIQQALKLATQRQGRHGDSYLLSNIMETCKDSLCEEPRDKVYGFVSIAHDCEDGSLPIDYGKSLFELYEDVIRFHYQSAEDPEDEPTSSRSPLPSLPIGYTNPEMGMVAYGSAAYFPHPYAPVATRSLDYVTNLYDPPAFQPLDYGMCATPEIAAPLYPAPQSAPPPSLPAQSAPPPSLPVQSAPPRFAPPPSLPAQSASATYQPFDYATFADPRIAAPLHPAPQSALPQSPPAQSPPPSLALAGLSRGDRRVHYESSTSSYDSSTVSQTPKSIVNFSQALQELLGGSEFMLADLGRKPSPLSFVKSPSNDGNAFVISALYSGEISILGPSYDEILSNPATTRLWKAMLSKCRTNVARKVCPIEPQFAWNGTRLKSQSKSYYKYGSRSKSRSRSVSQLRPDYGYNAEPHSKHVREKQPIFKIGPREVVSAMIPTPPSDHPRLFATEDGIIGLVPAVAQKGDSLIQFWGLDVAAVVRPEGPDYLRIIGRGVVANSEYVEGQKFFIPVKSEGDTVLCVYMDIRTLQVMTQ